MTRQAVEPKCPQCGGPVAVAEGHAYARCRYCSAESFVDLTGAILHQLIRPSIGRARVPGLVKARAHEAGWSDAQVTSLTLRYEPVWELECTDGRRVPISARAGDEGRFNLVSLPGGERVFTEERGDHGSEWLEPELAPESVPEAAARAADRPMMVKQLRLIHRPVYAGHATIAGQQSDFQLDGATGELFDIDWPIAATYRKRHLAWLATLAMALAAAALPLPVALPVVAALAAISVVMLRRDPARREAVQS